MTLLHCRKRCQMGSISVDEDVLKLDGTITNRDSVPIKFCDTDVALTIL